MAKLSFTQIQQASRKRHSQMTSQERRAVERYETRRLRKMDVERMAQDKILEERHRGFDLAAKDPSVKYQRPTFAVVGEGTKAAQDNYRNNYDKIQWDKGKGK